MAKPKLELKEPSPFGLKGGDDKEYYYMKETKDGWEVGKDGTPAITYSAPHAALSWLSVQLLQSFHNNGRSYKLSPL